MRTQELRPPGFISALMPTRVRRGLLPLVLPPMSDPAAPIAAFDAPPSLEKLMRGVPGLPAPPPTLGSGLRNASSVGVGGAAICVGAPCWPSNALILPWVSPILLGIDLTNDCATHSYHTRSCEVKRHIVKSTSASGARYSGSCRWMNGMRALASYVSSSFGIAEIPKAHLKRKVDGEPAHHSRCAPCWVWMNGKYYISEQVRLKEARHAVTDTLPRYAERECGNACIVRVGQGQARAGRSCLRWAAVIKCPARLHISGVIARARPCYICHCFQKHHIWCFRRLCSLVSRREAGLEPRRDWCSSAYFTPQLRRGNW